jgi:subtilisin family serine protease
MQHISTRTGRPARSSAVLLLAVVISGLAVLLPSSAASGSVTGPSGRDEQVIVVLRPAAALSPAVDAERRAGGAVRRVFHGSFRGYAATVSSGRVATLRADPHVLDVVADTRLHALDTQASPPWGLDRIDQRNQGLDQAYSYDTTGLGVVAFVVDTGIRATHTQFTGRVLPGHDFVDGDSQPADCNGHGTHVAGTIGGTTYGVAKSVSLTALRVLDCQGEGSLSDTLAAFDWVVNHKPAGPAVVNFSVGGPPSTLLDQAVERTVAAGIAVVVAAGNEDQDACGGSPARAPGAVTVGASTPSDARASFSDFGPCIDLFAPGTDVLSAAIGSDSATAVESGTSMSAPHVTGAVARYLQTHPAASASAVAAALDATSTLGVVTGAQSSRNDLLYTGTEPQPPRPPDPPGPTVTGAVSPSTVALDGTADGSYTVSVTTSGPTGSRLTARVEGGTTSDFLQFDNPEGDGRHWTATGGVIASEAAGSRTVTGFSALWLDADGLLVTTTFNPTSPVSFTVTRPVAAVVPSTKPPPLSTIRIVRVRWNAPGVDTRADASVNGEFVRLRNTGATRVVLSGWTLRDGQGHVFRFRRTTLAAGQTLEIHSGPGTRTRHTQFWGLRHHVWGNRHDVARLSDRLDRMVDTARWRRPGTGAGSF